MRFISLEEIFLTRNYILGKSTYGKSITITDDADPDFVDFVLF